MSPFDQELQLRLASLRQQGLYRELRCIDTPQTPRIRSGGKMLLNFSSNDYLGLANEPALKLAARTAVERYGAGTGASRLICGSLAPHHELDDTIARFKGVHSALSFATGYAAALGTITALVGKGDVVVIDKLVHASIVDAARLSGARLRVFAHNDLGVLEEILRWADKSARSAASIGPRSRILVVTESVFSMDGDHAPLQEMVALKERYGAWLMVDEAHATGLYGANGRGLCEELGVSQNIEVQMGTLGKALGASGGYICGSRALIEFLINKARSFIFSTAPVPAAAAAAAEGLRLVMSNLGEQRRSSLWQRVAALNSGLGPQASRWKSAILPLIIGNESKAIEAATALRDAGVFIPAIRYPTVARGAARLRVTVSASHTRDDIGQLLGALAALNLESLDITADE
ncbi:MAG TPA: 8-amino-7-oxononanoate synthase [Verrucomicrobiae bacterium]